MNHRTAPFDNDEAIFTYFGRAKKENLVHFDSNSRVAWGNLTPTPSQNRT